MLRPMLCCFLRKRSSSVIWCVCARVYVCVCMRVCVLMYICILVCLLSLHIVIACVLASRWEPIRWFVQVNRGIVAQSAGMLSASKFCDLYRSLTYLYCSDCQCNPPMQQLHPSRILKISWLVNLDCGFITLIGHRISVHLRHKRLCWCTSRTTWSRSFWTSWIWCVLYIVVLFS